jgi:hypothetical protein
MKKIIILVLAFCLLHTLCLHAQEQDNKLSTISLAVVIPENVDGLTASQLSKLESKITSIVSESGIAASGYNQNFVIYPKFEIYNVQESKGGLRNITVADCNLSLYVKQVSTKQVFSSYNKAIKGSGFNREEAIVNALSQINSGSEEINGFINKAKEKIVAYYNQNCDIILQKAERERMQKKYESALSILLSIPEEAEGSYAKAQPKAILVFKELQQYNCKKYLQEATTYAANNDYDNALKRLSWIDPTISCGNEAKALLNTIAKEADEDKKKEWDLLFKVYEGKIEVAKAQAQAMTSITTAWMLSQPSVSYSIIF